MKVDLVKYFGTFERVLEKRDIGDEIIAEL